jgi:hypothetical protein
MTNICIFEHIRCEAKLHRAPPRVPGRLPRHGDERAEVFLPRGKHRGGHV